jgi:hypothetical protein
MFESLPSHKNFATRKEWEAALWRAVIAQCLKDGAGSQGVFSLITSPGERRIIARRAAAIGLLSSGSTYREVGRELWLSPQTISSLTRGLKTRQYESSWQKTKQKRTSKNGSHANQNQNKNKKAKFQRYRRTKYGKVPMPF